MRSIRLKNGQDAIGTVALTELLDLEAARGAGLGGLEMVF